jgi:hypothetical protein
LVHSGAYLTAAVRSIIVITTITVASVIITASKSKDSAQSDNQGNECHDVVDNSGNIAADCDSMEGPGSVPLLSRSRVTQSIALYKS